MSGPGQRRLVRPIGATVVLLAFLVLPSCNLLADEFTWLDRAGPVAEDPQRSLRLAPVDRP